jgi:hypothetical protein
LFISSFDDQSQGDFQFTDGLLSLVNSTTSVYAVDIIFDASITSIGGAAFTFVQFPNLPTILSGSNYFYGVPNSAQNIFDFSFSFSQVFTPAQIGNGASFGFSINSSTSVNGRLFALRNYSIVVRKLYSG